MAATFLSTLPARGATLAYAGGLLSWLISIHAPREGSDEQKNARPDFLPISIHAPREGSDGQKGPSIGRSSNFYPRSPRGERRAGRCGALAVACISIHAPREGSDGRKVIFNCYGYISIHAPREGSDGAAAGYAMAIMDISIHAPREGSDQVQAAQIKDGK